MAQLEGRCMSLCIDIRRVLCGLLFHLQYHRHGMNAQTRNYCHCFHQQQKETKIIGMWNRLQSAMGHKNMRRKELLKIIQSDVQHNIIFPLSDISPSCNIRRKDESQDCEVQQNFWDFLEKWSRIVDNKSIRNLFAAFLSE